MYDGLRTGIARVTDIQSLSHKRYTNKEVIGDILHDSRTGSARVKDIQPQPP